MGNEYYKFCTTTIRLTGSTLRLLLRLDFMQPDVEIIELPTGVSLETILLKPPVTTSSEETKLAICLHPWSWLGGRMEDPWVVHTPLVLTYTS